MNQPVLTDLFVPQVYEEKNAARVDKGTLSDRQDLPRRPTGDTSAPFRKGSHASWTGARAQGDLKLWTEKQSALLQMLANGQPLTRNQLALFLHWPLSSVCSILKSVWSQVEFVDYESYRWSDTRITKRERFQVKR